MSSSRYLGKQYFIECESDKHLSLNIIILVHWKRPQCFGFERFASILKRDFKKNYSFMELDMEYIEVIKLRCLLFCCWINQVHCCFGCLIVSLVLYIWHGLLMHLGIKGCNSIITNDCGGGLFHFASCGLLAMSEGT